MWIESASNAQPFAATASGIPRDEWDLMFAAVVSRLRRTSESPPVQLQALSECIEALEQLHAALGREVAPAGGSGLETQETHEARERRDIREMWRARSGP